LPDATFRFSVLSGNVLRVYFLPPLHHPNESSLQAYPFKGAKMYEDASRIVIYKSAALLMNLAGKSNLNRCLTNWIAFALHFMIEFEILILSQSFLKNSDLFN
jgi:hypothetical protein